MLRIFFLPSSLFLLLGKKQRKKKKKKMSSSTSSSSQRKEALANNRERLDRWRKHILLGYYSRANSSREKNAATNDDEDGLKTSSSPLNATRREYEKLRGEFFFSSFSTKTRTTRRRAREGEEEEEEETCSPLSAMKKQNFPLVFQKKELVRVIRQDVERVVFAEEKGFGGKKFWRSPEVRASLIRVLTVFVLGSGDARRREYKQGMHEIAAMVYLATSRAASSSLVADDGVGSGNNDGEGEEEEDEEDEDNEEGEGDYDALLDVPLALAPRDDEENNEEDVEGYEYSQKFIEHDCYALFSAFMNNTRSSLRLLDYFQSQNESFIEEYCERFRRTMHAADEVTESVFFGKISLTRLYLPRFLKLAYLRECKRCDFLLMIWDSIIAEMGREGGKESNAGQPSAREIFESLSVAAVLRCKDTITREIALYSNESIGNILNEINAKSFDFSTPSDVEKLIETAKRIAAAAKDCEIVGDNDQNENEEEEEQQFFDESVFKSNLFSAMEIRTDGSNA